MLFERYRPGELARRGRSAATEFLNVVGSVPRDIARLLREARRGKTRIDLDLKRLDDFGQQLDATLDRVTIGHHDRVARDRLGDRDDRAGRSDASSASRCCGAIGFAGYALAFVNSVWVIYGIWRNSRKT